MPHTCVYARTIRYRHIRVYALLPTAHSLPYYHRPACLPNYSAYCLHSYAPAYTALLPTTARDCAGAHTRTVSRVTACHHPHDTATCLFATPPSHSWTLFGCTWDPTVDAGRRGAAWNVLSPPPQQRGTTAEPDLFVRDMHLPLRAF